MLPALFQIARITDVKKSFFLMFSPFSRVFNSFVIWVYYVPKEITDIYFSSFGNNEIS